MKSVRSFSNIVLIMFHELLICDGNAADSQKCHFLLKATEEKKEENGYNNLL